MRWQTKLFIYNLTVLLFLCLPWGMGRTGLYTPEGRYLQVNWTERSFPYLYQQIYKEKAPIDILCLGASILWSGIDSTQIEKELDKALGRKTHVVTLAWNHTGMDVANIVLRDLLKRRKVGMIVSYPPGTDETPGHPHPMIASFLQYDSAEFLFPHVSPFYRSQLYAALVLGAPRQLWGNLAAHDWRPSPHLMADHGWNRARKGYRGAPFTEVTELNPPQLPPAQWIYGEQAKFRFLNIPLPKYESSLFSLLGTLAAQNQIPLVLTHIPRDFEWESDDMPQRMDWTNLLPGRVALVGIPGKTLYRGKSRDWVNQLYYDTHLNENGARYFTRALAPTLIHLFQKWNGNGKDVI